MENDGTYLKLQDYIAEGSKGELTAEERAYEDLLFATVGIVRREGRVAAREWLVADRGCTRREAARIISEAMNLFYQTDDIKREAWRNLLFEKVMQAISDWEHTMVSHDDEGERRCTAKAKDYEALAKLVKQASALKRLSEPDEPQGPQVVQQQVNIYGTNAQDVGLPYTDRNAILQNPYFKQLRQKDQQRLAMEIGAVPLDIDTMLDNSTEIAEEVAGGSDE